MGKALLGELSCTQTGLVMQIIQILGQTMHDADSRDIDQTPVKDERMSTVCQLLCRPTRGGTNGLVQLEYGCIYYRLWCISLYHFYTVLSLPVYDTVASEITNLVKSVLRSHSREAYKVIS